MILSLHSEAICQVERVYRHYNRGIYGLPFHYDECDCYAGMLGQGENLFISASGMNNTIGFERRSLKFSPQELAEWLVGTVLPMNYWGHIYISANGAKPLYINQLLLELGHDFSHRIFGMFCVDGHHIEPPGYSGWIAALA